MSSETRIPTNLRTLLILEVLGREDKPIAATEIVDHMGLPKQTVHRLCATLEEEGFLIREPNGRKFIPGARLKALASGILYASRGDTTRRQVLEHVARQTNETVNLVIPQPEGMLYIDRVETDWSFRIQLPVGTHVPFHCTASGKVYMASLPAGRRRAMVRSLNLDARTNNTHTEPETLLKELSRISRDGYSVDNEEFLDHMIAVSVPVLDPEGRYCASLAFHAPTQRLSLADAMNFRQTLLDAAKQLSEVMFR